MSNISWNKTPAVRAVRSFLQRYPAVARPIWNAYYQLFPKEIGYLRDGSSDDREHAFAQIFTENRWECDESRSGAGSTLANTGQVRKHLPRLIERYGVRTLLDAPCGDFNWMKLVSFPSDLTYIGADIVPEITENLSRRFGAPGRKFVKLDVVKDPLPDADMWLCRHLTFHLPDRDIIGLLRNFKDSNIRYILVTNNNFIRRNIDVNAGGYRFANLRKAPFNLPKPLFQFDDYVLLGPPHVLGLWAREQIPDF